MSDSQVTTDHTARDATAREFARIADHKIELEAMRRLGNPPVSEPPLLVIDAMMDQLEVTYGRRWQEFRDEADTVHAEAMLRLLAARREAVREREVVR
jgi:hypothetical protein